MRFSLISCCNTAAYADWAQCGSCQFDLLGVYRVCPLEAQAFTPSLPLRVALSHLGDAASGTNACYEPDRKQLWPGTLIMPKASPCCFTGTLYLRDAIEAFCASRSFCAILCFQHLDIYCRHTPLQAYSFLFVRINPIAHVK
jgi:hypothetical protein